MNSFFGRISRSAHKTLILEYVMFQQQLAKKKQPEIRLLCSNPDYGLNGGSRCGIFCSSFAKAIAELLNTTTHVVHRFLCTGVEGM